MSMSRVTITDAAYRRSHLRAPKGRGGWLFQPSISERAYDADLVGDVVGFNGTYAEARAAAIALYDGTPVAFVAVLP